MVIPEPCFHCPDRHPICHDSCPRYAEYKRQLKEQRVYTKTKNAGGYLTPYSYPLSDIGRRLFYTPGEAAQLAKRMTEDEEKMLWCSDPLRRPWAEYIMPAAEQTSLFQGVSG